MTSNTHPTPGPLTVVKLGGALVDTPGAMADVWAGVQALRSEGDVVLVHGGGPQATALAHRMGHTPRKVHGRRVTTDLDLDLVVWTMRGGVNTRLVAGGQARGLPTLGLSGVDGGLLRVTRRPPWQIDGETVDFGWVGEVADVEASVLHRLLAVGFLPVVAPLGLDTEGQVYNVNADTVAAALAGGAGAQRLLLVTDSGGLRRDLADPIVVPRCDAALASEGVAAGWIQGGMRVKLDVAFAARRAGVPEVFILAPDDLASRQRATQID